MRITIELMFAVAATVVLILYASALAWAMGLLSPSSEWICKWVMYGERAIWACHKGLWG